MEMGTVREHYPLDSLISGVIDGLLDMGVLEIDPDGLDFDNEPDVIVRLLFHPPIIGCVGIRPEDVRHLAPSGLRRDRAAAETVIAIRQLAQSWTRKSPSGGGSS